VPGGLLQKHHTVLETLHFIELSLTIYILGRAMWESSPELYAELTSFPELSQLRTLIRTQRVLEEMHLRRWIQSERGMALDVDPFTRRRESVC